jgi:hypothetical protein
MKSLMQRAANVLAILLFAFASYLPFAASRNPIEIFVIALALGAVTILAINYVFFGKVTLWNRDEEEREPPS